VIMQKLCFCRY